MPTARRALVLVDVQQQYFDGPLEIQYPSHDQSLPKITAAIDAAVAADIPVAVIQHTMGTGARVQSERARFRTPPRGRTAPD